MPPVSKLLIDPWGNANYIYICDTTNPENSQQIYGISGSQYNIEYGYENQLYTLHGEIYNVTNMPFIGYGVSMELYDSSGRAINLPGINSNSKSISMKTGIFKFKFPENPHFEISYNNLPITNKSEFESLSVEYFGISNEYWISYSCKLEKVLYHQENIFGLRLQDTSYNNIEIINFDGIPLDKLNNQFNSFSGKIRSGSGTPTIMPRTTLQNCFAHSTISNEDYGDIEEWNTENVINMQGMFYYARSFNRNLGKWNYSNLNNEDDTISDIFMGSGLTLDTYSAFLIDMSNNDNLSDLSLNFGEIPIIDNNFFNHLLNDANNNVSEAYNYLTGTSTKGYQFTYL